MNFSIRSSEREPADSLRDKSNIIDGWLPSLIFAFDKDPFYPCP